MYRCGSIRYKTKSIEWGCGVTAAFFSFSLFSLFQTNIFRFNLTYQTNPREIHNKFTANNEVTKRKAGIWKLLLYVYTRCFDMNTFDFYVCAGLGWSCCTFSNLASYFIDFSLLSYKYYIVHESAAMVKKICELIHPDHGFRCAIYRKAIWWIEWKQIFFFIKLPFSIVNVRSI